MKSRLISVDLIAHLREIDKIISDENLKAEDYKIAYDYMNVIMRKIIIKKFDIPLAYTEEQKNII